jgi:hypothetical protein
MTARHWSSAILAVRKTFVVTLCMTSPGWRTRIRGAGDDDVGDRSPPASSSARRFVRREPG